MCASNQSILSLRLASTTADLIPYPFGSGIEEQIPVLPGWIQVPSPLSDKTFFHNNYQHQDVTYCSSAPFERLWYLSADSM